MGTGNSLTAEHLRKKIAERRTMVRNQPRTPQQPKGPPNPIPSQQQQPLDHILPQQFYEQIYQQPNQPQQTPSKLSLLWLSIKKTMGEFEQENMSFTHICILVFIMFLIVIIATPIIAMILSISGKIISFLVCFHLETLNTFYDTGCHIPYSAPFFNLDILSPECKARSVKLLFVTICMLVPLHGACHLALRVYRTYIRLINE